MSPGHPVVVSLSKDCPSSHKPHREKQPFDKLRANGWFVSASSIVDREAAHFGAMAGDWWDPDGASAMLHKLNPVRLGYIRDRIDQHWHLDECTLRPLTGKTALDVGCGAGLLA